MLLFVFLLGLPILVSANNTTVGSNYSLEVFDSSDYFSVANTDPFYIYAEYRNATDSSQKVNSSYVNCSVQFNGTGQFYNLSYSNSQNVGGLSAYTGFYGYFIASSLLQYYTVSCNMLTIGYENFTINDLLFISTSRLSVNVTKNSSLGSLFTTGQTINFSATYLNYTNSSLSSGNCNISFLDDSSYNNSMTYDFNSQKFEYVRNFSTNGTKNYSVYCSSTNFSSLSVNSSIFLIENRPFFTEIFNSGNSSLDARLDSVIAFIDLNESDNEKNVVQCGYFTARPLRTYSITNNSLTYLSALSSSVINIKECSFTIADVYGDGAYTLYATGANSSGFSNGYLANFSSSLLTSSSSDLALRKASTSLYVDGNTKFLIGSGINLSSIKFLTSSTQSITSNISAIRSGIVSFLRTTSRKIALSIGISNYADDTIRLGEVFAHNGSAFEKTQNINSLSYTSGSCGRISNNLSMYCILSGNTSTVPKIMSYLILNNGTFVNIQNLSGIYKGTTRLLDIDNDGMLDLLTLGTTQNGSKSISIYLNNGSDLFNYSLTTYIPNSVGVDYVASLDSVDIEDDGDLDIVLSGYDGSSAYTGVWFNNMSLWNPNYPPSQMVAPNVTYNTTTGQLVISWQNATDDKTPAAGLTYNINVGTTPTSSDIVSGLIGVSTSDTMLAMGNMQYDTEINLSVPLQTYYVKVQALDTSLRKSAWSSQTIYSPASCTVTSQGLNITQSCSFSSNINLSTDTSITLDNASSVLIVSQSNITLNGSSNYSSGIMANNGAIRLDNVTIKNQNASNWFYFNSTTPTSLNSVLLINASIYLSGFYTNLTNVQIIGNLTINSSNIRLENVSATQVTILQNSNATNITYGSITVAPSKTLNKLQLVTIQTNPASTNILVNGTYENSTYTNVSSKTILLNASYVTTSTEIYYNNYSINVSKRGYFPNVSSINVSSQQYVYITLNATNEPDWSAFENNLTTNLTTLALNGQLTNVSNLQIGITNRGLISFNSSVNLFGVNLTNIVRITNNSIYVNGSSVLNVSANLTFYNQTFSTTPIALVDGVVCTDCTNKYYDTVNRTYYMTVAHFSNYSLAQSASLSVNLRSNYFKYVPDNFIYFDLNFTNVALNSSFIGAICNVSLANGTTFSSTYNISSSVYTSAIVFATNGTFSYTANCSSSGAEPSSVTSQIAVHPDVAEFTQSSLIIPGVAYSSIIAYAGQTYVWGVNSSNSNLVFSLNSSTVTTDLTSIPSMKLGFVAAADFRHTGEIDFILKDTTNGNPLKWVKNVTGTISTTTISGTAGFDGGSITLLDVNNDSYMDVFVTPSATYELSHLLINNRAGFTVVSIPYGLTSSKLLSYDINNDGYDDILMTGLNSSSKPQFIVLENDRNNSFNINSSYPFANISGGSLARIDNNLNFILVSGANASGQNTTLIYKTYPTLTLYQTLPPYLSGYVATGDINNDGWNDFVISGYNNTIISLDSQVYYYTGSVFQKDSNKLFDAVRYSSGVLYDIDSDGDLDLISSGQLISQRNSTLYLSDESRYTNNTPPSTPDISLNYTTNTSNSNSTIHLNWSTSSDNQTSTNMLTYNVRLGTAVNKNYFISGISYSSSNPTVQFRGNMYNKTQITYSGVYSTQCLYYGVQAFDSGLASSNWNEHNISYTETCDGYDNNCDGYADETWDTNNDGFVQNVPACAAYLAANPTKVDNCDTAVDQITSNSVKDCPSVNVITNNGGSGGGGGSTSTTTQSKTDPIDLTKETVPKTDTIKDTSTPTENTALPTADSSSKASRDITLEYLNGKTYVTEIVRNKQRTNVYKMNVVKQFPKSILENASLLKSVTPFTIIEEDPIISFDLGSMAYLQEKPLVYSIPGTFTLAEIKQIVTDIETTQELTEEQIAQKEVKESLKAVESLKVNVSEKVVDNKTEVTIDLETVNGITSVQDVEIEQYIPKCLISEINQTVLDAGVDKSLLGSVYIKEADPIIVWNLKEVDAQTLLTLKLDALRPEDCDDEIKIKTLAREYIRANYQINVSNLAKSVIFSIALFLLFIVLFIVGENLKGEHENPHIHRLVKIALHKYHRGLTFEKIKQEFLANKEPLADITEALRHIQDKKLHEQPAVWRGALEHGIEIFIFISALILNGIEFFGLLPGYLDWVKKVLSWVLILILFYKIDMTKLVFNNSKRWINIALLTGMFAMHLKTLVSSAKSQSLEENTYFIFDLYAYILNHAHFFNVTLFYIGAGIVLIASIAMALTVEVKDGCLYFAVTHHPIAHTLWQKIKRSLKLFIIYMFFGFAIFNRVVEWLGVAIDTTVFMMSLLLLLFILASTTFIHNHKPLKRRSLEILVHAISANGIWLLLGFIFVFSFFQPFLSSIVVQSVLALVSAIIIVVALYTIITGVRDHFSGLEHISAVIDNVTVKFIKLFSHPSTIFLGVSGLFLLQHIVEISLYIIPNVTGETNTAYTQLAAGTLLGLFTDQSIIAAHLFTLSALDKVIYGSIYAISLLGGLFLFLVPLIVWALYFMHRGQHPSQLSVKELFFEKHGMLHKICQVILVFSVPCILTLVATKVLVVSYVSGLTENVDLGVVMSAHKLLMPQETQIIILGLVALYVIVAAILLRVAKTRDSLASRLVSITLVVSFVSLIWIYIIPYLTSIWSYMQFLWSSITAASFSAIMLIVVLLFLFALDVLIVYIAGVLILIFFGLPRIVKLWLIRVLSHIPFFHHLFFLASSLSHIDYYVESKEHMAGNVVHHVTHYLQTLEADGHHLETIIYQLKVHGYPQQIINEAIGELMTNKKFLHTVEHVKAEHLSVHQVKKLIPLIKAEYAKKTTPQEMYELFIDRFTHAEIKLALLYAGGDLKDEINVSRLKEMEDRQIQTLIGLVKKELAQKKSTEKIISDLSVKGYDTELIIKILEHPLFDKEEAKEMIELIVSQVVEFKNIKEKLDDKIVAFFNMKYPYPLFVKAMSDKRVLSTRIGKSLLLVVEKVVEAMKKGYTTEQILKAFSSKQWSAVIVHAIISYSSFVIASEHHLDAIIEKEYVELEE